MISICYSFFFFFLSQNDYGSIKSTISLQALVAQTLPPGLKPEGMRERNFTYATVRNFQARKTTNLKS